MRFRKLPIGPKSKAGGRSKVTGSSSPCAACLRPIEFSVGSAHRLLAIDHPGYAVAIDEHAEAHGPEGLRYRHRHRPALRQCSEYPVGVLRIRQLDRDGKAVLLSS